MMGRGSLVLFMLQTRKVLSHPLLLKKKIISSGNGALNCFSEILENSSPKSGKER